MNRFAYTVILTTVGLLLGAHYVVAGGVGLGEITDAQGNALIALFQGDTAHIGDIKGLPLASPSELEPILVTTGVHCVLASSAESLHQVQYLVGSGATSHRLVVSFTLSPPVAPGHGGASLASLLTHRQVTQYQIWSSSSSVDPHDHVVSFSSRSKHSGCGYAG